MDLQAQIIEDLGRKLATEMDQQILIGFMLELGWKEIVVDPWMHNSLKDIQAWTNKNIQGNVMHLGNRWVFEDAKDATMFALKWG